MSSDAMRVRDAAPRYRAETDVQAVPPGYKRTELGMIPDDWDIQPISALAVTSSGTTPPRSLASRYFHDGTVPWLKTLDLNNSVIRTTDERVTRAAVVERGLRLYPVGTVVIAMYGGFAQIGRTGLLSIASTVNQALTAITPKEKRLDSRYLLAVLNYRVEYWKSVASSSRKDPNITGRDVRDFYLPVPVVHEQRVIADALSDVDGLLGALEALISKMRAIKQAAMQQLLTGKTRLPGFSREWETKRLGRHVTFLRHGTHSRADLTADEPVRNLHYGDIHTSTEVFLNARETSMPRLAAYRAAGLDRLEDGDLVLVDASEDLNGVGKSVELTGTTGIDVVSGLHTIAARFDKSVLADGFKAYLQFCPAFRQQLSRLAAGTKVYATSRAHIASVEMSLPYPDEQAAIATVLSDMDVEIAALVARHEKARAIKQGMMQQLLTGRVRLAKPAAA